MTVNILEEAHIRLLKGQVRLFLESRREAERIMRKRCESRHQPYKGVLSWTEELRKWRRSHAKALLDLAREYGLCRKYIKDEVAEFRKDEPQFEKERLESGELDLKELTR